MSDTSNSVLPPDKTNNPDVLDRIFSAVHQGLAAVLTVFVFWYLTQAAVVVGILCWLFS